MGGYSSTHEGNLKLSVGRNHLTVTHYNYTYSVGTLNDNESPRDRSTPPARFAAVQAASLPSCRLCPLLDSFIIFPTPSVTVEARSDKPTDLGRLVAATSGHRRHCCLHHHHHWVKLLEPVLTHSPIALPEKLPKNRR